MRADRKRVVFLTDGQAPEADLDGIVSAMVADDIKVTTIAVGDEADHETLKRLADIGQGEFYPVYNPKALPRVLVDSVKSINKPLIKEGSFVPVVEPTGSSLTAGLVYAPPLGGLVVTVILVKVVGVFFPMRVDEEDEVTGLDLTAHGERAYDHAS